MTRPTAHPDSVHDSTFWRKIGKVAGRVPFTVEVVAAYYAMRDEDTPWRHKAVLAGAIAYFILPLDAVPDVIFPIGFSDDAAAITAAVAAASMSIREGHRVRARRVLGLDVPGDVVDGDVLDGYVFNGHQDPA